MKITNFKKIIIYKPNIVGGGWGRQRDILYWMVREHICTGYTSINITMKDVFCKKVPEYKFNTKAIETTVYISYIFDKSIDIISEVCHHEN